MKAQIITIKRIVNKEIVQDKNLLQEELKYEKQWLKESILRGITERFEEIAKYKINEQDTECNNEYTISCEYFILKDVSDEDIEILDNIVNNNEKK